MENFDEIYEKLECKRFEKRVSSFLILRVTKAVTLGHTVFLDILCVGKSFLIC